MLYMLVIIGGVLAILIVYSVLAHNSLVKLENHCSEAWSNVDTELKRRYNLIPNLVNTVKAYTEHENNVLFQVTRYRQMCVNDLGPPTHQANTENMLIKSLQALLARVEDYPDLKASTNYLQLQQELVNTEDRIQAARRFYNGNVREHNNKVEMFPSNIIARRFGFKNREFFEIDDIRAKAPPKVDVG